MVLKIRSVRLDSVDFGGYRIARDPTSIPMGHRLLLGVSPAPWEHIDVTTLPPGDLISPFNLPPLLRLFQRHLWPRNLSVRLFLAGVGHVTNSEPVILPGPVEPHSGPLLPLAENKRPSYKYLFKKPPKGSDPDGHGRMLCDFPGLPGLFFFTEKGRFETEPKYRGFGCILYVGAVCGMRSRDWKGLATEVDEDPESDKSALTSFDLAHRLNATIILQKQPREAVKRFFETNPAGYFLMWSGGHVVMVVNQTVYEFNRWKKIDGYGATPVQERLGWYGLQKTFTVARLPSKPPLAE